MSVAVEEGTGRRYAEHDGTRVYVCPRTVPGRWGTYDWPCLRADGHDGDCRPSTEWADYPVPFTEQTREWLTSEARLLHHQVTTERARRVEDTRRRQEQTAAATAVLHDVLAHRPRGSKAAHPPGCYRRHPACLARLLLVGDPHDAREALAAALADRKDAP